ncbi:hypothetical protein CC78DRAFT_582453 [Lojkania enalia]|uniref:Uncharacterized protein n=1 Tax=Lojkania enalia TaxID=147567 RepID=A0A9P4K9I5_9PLEO|nr:hypothetical protein CC78DRAFT_582453 [Didymosphaeria enalia]
MALQGQRLSEFSVNKRMRWAAERKTTVKEHKVYCLLEIFGVFIPLTYGEGEHHPRTSPSAKDDDFVSRGSQITPTV